MTRNEAVHRVTAAIKAYRNGRSDRSPDTIAVDLIQLEILGLITFDDPPAAPITRVPTPIEVMTAGINDAKLSSLPTAGIAEMLLNYLHRNGYDIVKRAAPGAGP